jgi:hypothetical protein
MATTTGRRLVLRRLVVADTFAQPDLYSELPPAVTELDWSLQAHDDREPHGSIFLVLGSSRTRRHELNGKYLTHEPGLFVREVALEGRQVG